MPDLTKKGRNEKTLDDLIIYFRKKKNNDMKLTYLLSQDQDAKRT